MSANPLTTKFMEAAAPGDVEAIKECLEQGADVKLGLVKMMIRANPKVDLLTRFGVVGLTPANIQMTDKCGVTPLELAGGKGCAGIGQILLQAGAR